MAISWKRCKIGGKLVLVTNRKLWAFNWHQNRWPWMTLNGVMAVILRYFTEFSKHAFQHITASICGGIYAQLYFVVRVRCRRQESSRSLSHLLMSFLVYRVLTTLSRTSQQTQTLRPVRLRKTSSFRVAVSAGDIINSLDARPTDGLIRRAVGTRHLAWWSSHLPRIVMW